MSANVGNLDRIVRILIGIAAFAFAFMGPVATTSGWARIALIIVGVIMIGTSVIKFCPLYRLIGARTRK